MIRRIVTEKYRCVSFHVPLITLQIALGKGCD